MPTKVVGSTSSNYRATYDWVRSPRDSEGNLILKTNPVTAQKWILRNKKGLTFANLWLTNANGEGDVRKGSALSNQAYTRAYDRFRGKVWGDAQAMLLVDIAERQKTIEMITDAVSRIYKAAKAVKKGRFAKAAKLLSLGEVPKGLNLKDHPSKAFTDNWLAYRYGWTPLYGSVNSLMEILDKPIENRFVRASATVKNMKTEHFFEPWSPRRVTQTDFYTQETRAVLKARMVVSNPTWARLKQFGLLNPLEVAWELVPFSFVADWFLPIGAYLEDMTSFTGISFIDGSVTYHGQSERTSIDVRHWLPTYYGSFHESVYIYKNRVVGNNFVPPARSFFNNGLNAVRCLDAISLLRSVLAGRS